MLIIIKIAPLVLMAAAMTFLIRGNNEKPDYFWFFVCTIEAFFIQYAMVS